MEAAVHTSSLALSLLRQSSHPSESFILSPFSLNSALAIVHDGASGTTQQELTNLLLNGTPSDVTNYYSSLTLSLPSSAETVWPINQGGVAFKIANRFYIDDSISLNHDYQKHVEEKYHVQIKNLNMRKTDEALLEINEFVEGATGGKIKNMIKEISSEAILVNAIHFLGKWKYPFRKSNTHHGTFKGYNGDRQVDFMMESMCSFRAYQNNDIGTVLVMPYKNDDYNFFFVMPNETSNLEKMRNELTGAELVKILMSAEMQSLRIYVPKFKIESKMHDAIGTLSELGVKTLFGKKADLSKISSRPFTVSQILHNAMIEVDEMGTEAAAATVMQLVTGCSGCVPPKIIIDRPFLFGILGNDNILFIGQYD